MNLTRYQKKDRGLMECPLIMMLAPKNSTLSAPWLSWLQRPTVKSQSEGREFEPLWGSMRMEFSIEHLSISLHRNSWTVVLCGIPGTDPSQKGVFSSGILPFLTTSVKWHARAWKLVEKYPTQDSTSCIRLSPRNRDEYIMSKLRCYLSRLGLAVISTVSAQCRGSQFHNSRGDNASHLDIGNSTVQRHSAHSSASDRQRAMQGDIDLAR
ncbi:hypothetical protein EV421DRAFT_1096757 [Armillaria borealis]|uniref:Uncharacterized protein n=1 Tax=Armillaria borealis TaxID=47425 RepID=A0AA39MJU4_9AGAR|nr:hypothetical protein EV421DRAFT_1096757 [Armillaria borealis]